MVISKIFVILMTLYYASILSAQIQTTILPEPGFEERIREAVNDIWLIDTHEHLETEGSRLQKDDLDFTELFRHYAIEDLISASNEHGIISIVFGHYFPLQDRWELFKPFFGAMRNTAYARAALIAANDLFGISDLNDDTYAELSEKIRQANRAGWYKQVLKDRARIELSIQDAGHKKFDKKFYRHVERFDNFIDIYNAGTMKRLGKRYGVTVKILDDYVAALRKAFKAGLDYQMVGVKSGLAYNRILKYENTSEKKAKEVFAALMNREPSVRSSFEEVKPLQDYMMHRMLDLAEEFEIPVQIHTGLHAGNGNYITNSNPTLLTNLFFEYPKVNFCLFHGSYPYGGELSVLAKNFPNVFVDMSWSYVISPSYSERYLHEWLETVPANKIMAFGGDYSVVELVYAHAVMARRVVTKVLVDKVAAGYFSEKEAIDIARRLLRENAMEVFRLNGRSRSIENMPALTRPGLLHDWWKLHQTTKGFIRQWLVIGPFEFGQGLDTIYPPEKEIKLNASYKGANGVVKWKKVVANESGYLDLAAAFYEHPEENEADLTAIAYAYAEVESADDRKIKLTLGSNDGAKLWINGELIYSEHIGRGAVADQVFLEAYLHKGKNKILAKVENLGLKWGLYLRLVDPDEKSEIMTFD